MISRRALYQFSLSLLMCAMGQASAAAQASDEIAALKADIQQLRNEVSELRQRCDALTQTFGMAKPTDPRQQELKKAILAGDVTALRAMAGRVNVNIALEGGKRPIELAIDSKVPDVFAAVLDLSADGGNPALKASDGRSLAEYLLSNGGPEMIEKAKMKSEWVRRIAQHQPSSGSAK